MLLYWLVLVSGTTGFRRFWIGVVCDRCRTACFRGLVRRLDLEIGFGPASGPWPVWRLAGHSPGTAVFRRFRMSADCGRLPDRLFPWTDPEIGHRNRIRYEGNTGISVCPAARPAGHHQRTMIFRLSWLGTVRGYALRRPAEWTGPGIGCGNPTRPPRAGRGRRHAVCVDCRFRCVSLPVSWCSGRRLGPALRYPVSTLRAPCTFKADGMP